jgi:hypothetical protein
LKVFIYLFMCHSEEKTTKDIRVWGLRRAPGSVARRRRGGPAEATVW